MKSAVNFIPKNYRLPVGAVGFLVAATLVSRLFSDTPETTVFQVETAAVAPTEQEQDQQVINDPYESCRLTLNSALIRYSTAKTETDGVITQGRAQDWRRWANERAQKNGSSEIQELRGAFAALSARIDSDHTTKTEMVGGQELPIDLLTIDGTVGEYRDLEGSRLDVATALVTATTTPYESVPTMELKTASTAFLDATGCLLGMEVINVE